MQPTYLQVERSLRALRDGAAAPVASLSDDIRPGGWSDVPQGLLDLLRAAPPVRLDRMTQARMRLDAGRHPSDEDLADRLVGRLVCDRLR